MRIQRRAQPVEAGIFTDAIADITFLLVVFFVVTSILSATRGLGYHPDTDTDVPVVTPDEAIDIHVLNDGSIEVDRHPMPVGEIGDYLKAHLLQNPDKPVILRTDTGASYGAMVEVLDELHTAPEHLGFEIRTLAIPTQREIRKNWVEAALQQ